MDSNQNSLRENHTFHPKRKQWDENIVQLFN